MTLEEAIAHAREVAEYKREMAEGVWRKKLNKPDFPWGRDVTKEEVERKEKECVRCAKDHEQLAEWLEELKFLRTTKETMFREIYNQALEDFEKCVIQQSGEGWSGMVIDEKTLKSIKEQLKR